MEALGVVCMKFDSVVHVCQYFQHLHTTTTVYSALNLINGQVIATHNELESLLLEFVVLEFRRDTV